MAVKGNAGANVMTMRSPHKIFCLRVWCVEVPAISPRPEPQYAVEQFSVWSRLSWNGTMERDLSMYTQVLSSTITGRSGWKKSDKVYIHQVI